MKISRTQERDNRALKSALEDNIQRAKRAFCPHGHSDIACPKCLATANAQYAERMAAEGRRQAEKLAALSAIATPLAGSDVVEIEDYERGWIPASLFLAEVPGAVVITKDGRRQVQPYLGGMSFDCR